MSMTRIGLDVLGGDHAPETILKGALEAVADTTESALVPERIVLFGDESAIEVALQDLGGNPGFAISHAPEAIGMEEKPAQALRAKRNSSISLGTKAVRAQQTGAFVSMGNTGAVVGAATLMLGTLAGVRRPGIAVTQHLVGRPVTVMDMGANTSPKPEDLLAYGVMGDILQRDCMGVQNPRVGLLNIGEEENKGTELLQQSYALLKASGLNFVGNVEGGDIFKNQADVILTDGFTGNVVLKLMEGMASFMIKLLVGELKKHGVPIEPAVLGGLARSVDSSEYGGALLLGVDGVVIIGHGSSDSRAVKNALHLAAKALDTHINQDIVKGLQSAGAVAPE
ncbi:MAG: glycerol-3-phosphate acyltransferase PlsX [Glaciecola sp.]|jgi:glycerol-3-phosphate acyltransferase PlsX